MAKKEFQAESKKLMDMMINSIYTNKEIFLRELISNASDAIDKLYYKSLADGATGLNRDDFQIFLAADKDSRTLRIRDNGIGIEDNIKAKIFEPFFTTKPTAEAAGVGLYLCREVILKPPRGPSS